MHSDQLSQNIETLITSIVDLQPHLDAIPIELLEHLNAETNRLKIAKQKSTGVPNTAADESHQLARDLHDSVTQTLFSASAVAETLPRVLDQNPDALRANLELLSRMTRGALSEMRVLLSELRPTSIVNTPFSMLLRQLVEALQARKLISASYELNDEPQLTPEVHIALYRIVQEALNNVSKHSQATQVIIRLQVDSGRIELHIRDNGRGFQPEKISSGMGLGMMRERSEAIGAQIDINKQDEGGTDVCVLWPSIASVAS